MILIVQCHYYAANSVTVILLYMFNMYNHNYHYFTDDVHNYAQLVAGFMLKSIIVNHALKVENYTIVYIPF